jgi:hypothetical protein
MTPNKFLPVFKDDPAFTDTISSLVREVDPDNILTRTQGKVKNSDGDLVDNKVPYIEGNYVIDRLNEAVSPMGWSYRRISEQIILDTFGIRKDNVFTQGMPYEVFVYGELEVNTPWGNVVKGDYGANGVKYMDESEYVDRKRVTTGRKVPLSIGDDIKGAHTDALKRCARQLGIYNYGYRKAKNEVDRDLDPLIIELGAAAKALGMSKSSMLDFCGGVVRKTVLTPYELSEVQLSLCTSILRARGGVSLRADASPIYSSRQVSEGTIST